MEKLTLTIKECKQLLGVGNNVMYDLVHTNGFPAFRIGHKWYIHNEKLGEWLDKQAVKKQ